MRHQTFACAHLSHPYLTCSTSRLLTMTFTTAAFDRSSSWRFEAGLWPSGHIQNRLEVIHNIADKKKNYTSMNYSGSSNKMAGNNALVRHREAVEAPSNANAWSVKFDVLQIWQKQDNEWKLLARQGWKT